MPVAEAPQRVAREQDVQKVLDLLQLEQVAKRDFVVPSKELNFLHGDLSIAGQEVIMGEDGVTDVNGVYELSNHAVNQLAEIFKIPGRYLKRMKDVVGSSTLTSTLFDTNLNAWASEDPRSFLVRGMIGETANRVRAILSDRYGIMENIDVLMAVIQGLMEVELENGTRLGPQNIRDIQVTESRLYIRVEAPEITALGGAFVEGLTSPFKGTGHGGVSAEHPELVHAGFVVTNSEIGTGALNATGEIIAKVCDNGAQMKDDRVRKVHVGGKLEAGQIKWGADTQAAQEKATRLMVRDAFANFLTTDWLEGAMAKVNAEAGFEVEDITKTIEVVSKELEFSKEEQASIMKMFFDGGQRTSGGVGNAITAAAQTLEDADRAHYFGEVALDAVKIAAKV